MPFRYRCHACAAEGRRGAWGDARTERAAHRARAHHGLAPDDEITRETGLLGQGARWLLATLLARRH